MVELYWEYVSGFQRLQAIVESAAPEAAEKVSYIVKGSPVGSSDLTVVLSIDGAMLCSVDIRQGSDHFGCIAWWGDEEVGPEGAAIFSKLYSER